ncbi:cytidylate kinase [Natranaerovirga hydrolytica]|uniref:Cytidylate kinase n=1 Tax=Natranaerovirga hydrolytica TaxID=680378 RepID=A0A4R1MXZ6_9FIRM|nr:(d)CMP kinase [Natranaerovirga hydrolytica]TCK97995.1 cytidylate kinase [Natranaerovirga hydrolytica]
MSPFKSIAIDGPAGAGKSTIAKKVAETLGYVYIDTGAMYRAIAYECIRKNINIKDEEAINTLCSNIDIIIQYVDGEQQVLLNNENVTHYIRTTEVGNVTSQISVYHNVRKKLVELQQKLAHQANVIMDGRDIGTYVLPNANLKIFLTASIEQRAQRRWKELNDKGDQTQLKTLEAQIKERDYNDMNRKIAPLKKAEDAIEVDTSNMSIEEVVKKVISLYNKRIVENGNSNG